MLLKHFTVVSLMSQGVDIGSIGKLFPEHLAFLWILAFLFFISKIQINFIFYFTYTYADFDEKILYI